MCLYIRSTYIDGGSSYTFDSQMVRLTSIVWPGLYPSRPSGRASSWMVGNHSDSPHLGPGVKWWPKGKTCSGSILSWDSLQARTGFPPLVKWAKIAARSDDAIVEVNSLLRDKGDRQGTQKHSPTQPSHQSWEPGLHGKIFPILPVEWSAMLILVQTSVYHLCIIHQMNLQKRHVSDPHQLQTRHTLRCEDRLVGGRLLLTYQPYQPSRWIDPFLS